VHVDIDLDCVASNIKADLHSCPVCDPITALAQTHKQRAAPELMSRPILGGFLKGGLCATVAWGIAWPIEVVKSKIQAADSTYRGRSMMSIWGSIVKADGVKGLYRGFLPGAMRSFVANGVGMAVYQFTQSLRTD
jgi:solute carrier family 25 carnitine/acylcarnitine transporter 20/29